VADAFVRWRWRRAHKEAWKKPPLSILKLRVARAEAAGVTYRDYMLELLDTRPPPASRRRSQVGAGSS
jgi:hypothetical protein